MRVRVLVSVVAPVLTMLVVGCQETQPFDPLLSDAQIRESKSSSPGFSAPTGANTVAFSESRIDVSWTDNSSNETGFEVHRSSNGVTGTFALLTTTAANVTKYSDNNVAPSQYCYKVRAVRSAPNGTTYSDFSAASCTTPLPSAPTNLTAVAEATDKIDLAWQDNSKIETNYQVWRAVGDTGAWYPLARIGADAVSYVDATAIGNPRYCYKVQAVRETAVAGGSSYTYSGESNKACLTVPPPSPASNADAKPTSSTSISVGWTDNSTNESGFHIYRSTDGGASWTLAGTEYFMRFDDLGRQPDQQVCYKVAAFNSAGEAAATNVDCATPPSSPTNFTASQIDSQTVALNWSDNSNVEEGYQVWVHWIHEDCNGMNASYYQGETLVANLPAGTTSFTFTPGNTGCGFSSDWQAYYVVATKDGGRSSPTEEIEIQ